MGRTINDPAFIADIKQILPDLYEYMRSGRSNNFTLDKRVLMRDLWERDIYPGGRVNLSCADCVIAVMNYIVSFWERETAAYMAKNPGSESLFDTSEIDTDKVAEVKVKHEGPVYTEGMAEAFTRMATRAAIASNAGKGLASIKDQKPAKKK